MVHDVGADTSDQTARGLPKSHFCTSCQVTFASGQEQRLHSKEEWHVYNIKRRIDSLPPISLMTFEEQNERRVDSKQVGRRRSPSQSSSKEESSDDEGDPHTWPFQCLFCNQSFGCDDIGFSTNLEHMRAVHGLFVPDQEMVFDLQSLFGYLATVVREWHECLYCGANKPSTSSVQSHMRAKGHCMLNLSREPELRDFWDSPSEASADVSPRETQSMKHLSETEMSLSSGKVIGSRHAAPTTKGPPAKQIPVVTPVKALASGPDDPTASLEDPQYGGEDPRSMDAPPLATGRQIARREQLGMAGLSLQHRQAIIVAEKRAQRCEAMAAQTREWVYGRGANAQKFDQIDNQGKWGKQNHKLLPR